MFRAPNVRGAVAALAAALSFAAVLSSPAPALADLNPIQVENSLPGSSGWNVPTLNPGTLEGYARLVYLFDGRDAAAVAKARELWKRAKDAGCATTYWQQSSEGRWENKA